LCATASESRQQAPKNSRQPAGTCRRIPIAGNATPSDPVLVWDRIAGIVPTIPDGQGGNFRLAMVLVFHK
jgi:hypothetical protein